MWPLQEPTTVLLDASCAEWRWDSSSRRAAISVFAAYALDRNTPSSRSSPLAGLAMGVPLCCALAASAMKESIMRSFILASLCRSWLRDGSSLAGVCPSWLPNFHVGSKGVVFLKQLEKPFYVAPNIFWQLGKLGNFENYFLGTLGDAIRALDDEKKRKSEKE